PLSILTVIIVGIFSYLKSSDIIQSNTVKEKQQSVYQIQANFEQVLKMVDLSVTDFVTSHQLLQTLDDPLTEYQFQLYNQTKKNLVQLQRFDTGPSDFMLASLTEGWRINNQGLRRLTEDETEHIKDTYLSTLNNSRWQIERREDVLFDSTADSTCEAFICLYNQLPINSSDKKSDSVTYF